MSPQIDTVHSRRSIVHRYILLLVTVLSCICSACYAAEPPRYEINAAINTDKHTITAHQNVTYTNNSSQELKELYFHIYPNRRYTRREVHSLYRYGGYFKINPFPAGFQRGSLVISNLKSANQVLSSAVEGPDQTIVRVTLAQPLAPGATTEIDFDFTVSVPHAIGRFGWHKDIMTLVRWYPIVSVFDEKGWHNYPSYLYHLPHFSDAAYYKVRLVVPAAQTVVPTGDITGIAENSDGTKTYEIQTAFPVRDFSVGVSSGFRVVSRSFGQTSINVYYRAGDELHAELAAACAADVMKYYSERFGAYPCRGFNIVPSFLGSGGLQTSGQIFVDTRVFRLPALLDRYFDFLITHETGHQWFYNVVGSDEYLEMFLDEGINSYWNLNYLEQKYGQGAPVVDLPAALRWLLPNFSFRDASLLRYLTLVKSGLDRPVVGELSGFQEPSSIFAIAYGKGAAVLRMLEGLIGKEKMLACMQEYVRRYSFRNASVADFIRVCNDTTGEDLGWFFNDWLQKTGTCDYSVAAVTPDKIIIKNNGQFSLPVTTRIVYRDGSVRDVALSGSDQQQTIPVEAGKQVKSVALDPGGLIPMDTNRMNNVWPRNTRSAFVPIYLPLYEIPVFVPRDATSVIAGPDLGGTSLGGTCLWQQPFDSVFRVSSDYDFDNGEIDSTAGYELKHLFRRAISLGVEVFNRQSHEHDNDLTGGKIYLRRDLKPIGYGLFEANDHLTLYMVHNQRSDASRFFSNQENAPQPYYTRHEETIAGVTGTLNRCGPHPDPVIGWRFTPLFESAGHFLGGHESFWRASTELDNYFLIVGRWQHSLATRLTAGWGEAADKKLYQLGGPDGLRGFDRKTIEGSRMLMGSIEYRLPLISDLQLSCMDNILSLDKIQPVFFFDAGRAWYSSWRAGDFRKDAGLGLRLHFDIAGFLEKVVVRFDVAHGIGQHAEDTHFWAGINHTF